VDVYDAIPTIVTTFVAIIAKISILIFLLDLISYTANIIGDLPKDNLLLDSKDKQSFSWIIALLLSSLFSLIIGTVLGALRVRTLRLCQKLSNFGDALKLLIPSDNRKIISGWVNYSCRVISQKIQETVIGNRGSKSVICNNITVKEQWVDGSWQGNILPCLRCTLMGFERNYPIRNLSNPININSLLQITKFTSINQKVFYSTSNIPQVKPSLTDTQSTFSNSDGLAKGKLHPDFITGFTDGEGFFGISVTKNNKLKTGWQIQLRFLIGLHIKDTNILEQIKEYFGVGSLIKDRADYIKYSVQSIEELEVIINHFEKHLLKTHKYVDFVLFKQAFFLIKNSEHLTVEGLIKIVSIKASINWGLSENLASAFPSAIAVERALISLKTVNTTSYWLAGFTSGEGSFIVTVFKSKTVLGYAVRLTFQLTQHSRDEQLLINVIEYLGCGKIYQDKEAHIFKVTKLLDINEKIIPFFEKYPVLGVKYKDFIDWCTIAKLMKEGKHLTVEGLEQIRSIKAGMNKGRDSSS
jgi:hypothetical protein